MLFNLVPDERSHFKPWFNLVFHFIELMKATCSTILDPVDLKEADLCAFYDVKTNWCKCFSLYALHTDGVDARHSDASCNPATSTLPSCEGCLLKSPMCHRHSCVLLSYWSSTEKDPKDTSEMATSEFSSLSHEQGDLCSVVFAT